MARLPACWLAWAARCGRARRDGWLCSTSPTWLYVSVQGSSTWSFAENWSSKHHSLAQETGALHMSEHTEVQYHVSCNVLSTVVSNEELKPCTPTHAAQLNGRYVRIWDDEDEALQPEWEIDPKDLQILEKV